VDGQLRSGKLNVEMHFQPSTSERHRRRSRPTPPTAIRVRHRFNAAPETIFGAWLDPRIAARWLFATASRPVTHVTIDARVGGSFRLVERENGRLIEHTGEYLEIVPPYRLAFTLSLEKHPRIATHVTVEIAALRKGCELALRHENVPRECARDIETRWTGILYGLGVTL
jgi:uncharacterized protein YndB with AHSA1/START domain